MNMPMIGAMFLTPATMCLPVSRPKPPIRAAMIGIEISATIGDSFFVMIAASITTIVKRPSNANINNPSALYRYPMGANSFERDRTAISDGRGRLCFALLMHGAVEHDPGLHNIRPVSIVSAGLFIL
ncbi:hypothetical protein IWX58_001790 [Rubrivivax gelatinosus]|nr:hypothetical protein [Rubrivivax gelatinosus]